jgi:hypothetical protein
LGLILDRRRHLVTFRHRTICRLHALLSEMIFREAPKHLTATTAAKMLRSVRPSTAVQTERREVAKQLLEDWRWRERHIPATEARLHETLDAHGSTLTAIIGIGDTDHRCRDHPGAGGTARPVPLRRALRRLQRHRPHRSVVGGYEGASARRRSSTASPCPRMCRPAGAATP